MATLHVRNVPDPLYEALRERAAENGRSIGAQTVCLIQESVLASDLERHALGRLIRRRRGGGSGFFTRFVAEARQAVVDAQGEARALGHNYIGTEHLLVALAAGSSTAADVLAELGLAPESCRERVVDAVGRGGEQPSGRLPFTPPSKKALELALREALRLRDSHIGPEHILLGVAAEEEGVGARILREAGADLEQLRASVLLTRARHPHAAPPVAAEPAEEFRVVELDGSARDWEAQLNAPAAEGLELVDIVERRAIFRRP